MTPALPEQNSSAQKGVLAPLSFVQQEIWLRSQLASSDPIYNEIVVLERKGSLKLQTLELVFSEITRRHAILRTVFGSADETPTQAIAEHLTAKLPITDLTGLPDSRRNSEVLRIAREEARQRFDLAKGPLMRARLIRVSGEDHVLVVTLHPMVADEWSRNVLASELDVLYKACSNGKPFPLPDLPFQYAEYARRQRSRLQGKVFDEGFSYWREQLTDISAALDLPTDRPRPPVQGSRGACEYVVFSKDLSESLKALSNREGVTLFAALLTGFLSLLSRYTAQYDIVVDSILHERYEVVTDSLIGPFARPVVIRVDLGGDPSLRELLRRVSDAVADVRERQNAKFEQVPKELQPGHDASRDHLSRVLFSYVPLISLDQWVWHPANFEVNTDVAKVVLELRLYGRPEGLVACFRYNTDLFEAATINRLVGHFQMLLQGMIAAPDVALSRLPLLTPAERTRQFVEWNDTYAEYPRGRCVHQLFEEQVGLTPDATAVVFENQELSYHELNSRANQLAHHLLNLGVGPDSLVGICVQRSPDMIAALLGIWKAGGAYVPLDPQYPSGRLSLMLEDSGLKVLIIEKPHQPKFSGYKGQLVYVDSEAICKERSENCSGGAKPENLAYVIYTSGSTGKPKGVQICHQSLANFLVSMRSSPGLAPEDTLLAVTTISFDIAALELYLPLIVGARLLLASRETAVDGYKLQRILASTAITVMQATPATWRLLLEAGWQGGNNFKILCGGEALPRDLAAELLKRGSSVWNMYGPTETTVWSTTSRIAADDSPITIGRPIANTEVYVLDSHLEPVPVGVPGELYIGGAGVARGYLHRPELTTEKFIAHPFRDRESGARLYRTGDLARFRTSGELECLGRIDNQVKVRGFRIELGEIESVLGQYPGVKESVVVAREDTPGDKRLVAYVAVHQEQSLGVDALRKFLKQRLPDYMLPSQFEFLEALPLTPNGKVDRKSLPKPAYQAVSQEEQVAPRNSIESQLAKIWESVLGVRTVGVRDNFFELGGHSLLVAKLLRRIEKAFAKKLSMAAIFEAPTVEQQASLLNNAGAFRWRSAVIPIQPSGSKPPFFCLGYNAGPIFLPLARCLGPDQPLLAIDPTLLEPGQLPVRCTMEDAAVCLAKQIRELHPHGPYYLGGFCGGGLVAYAIASELMAQGEKIAVLALFEPHTCYYDSHVKYSNGSRLSRRMRMLKFHLENLQELEFKQAPAYIRHRVRVHFRYLNGVFRQSLNRLGLRPRNGRARDISEILTVAYHGYRPQPFTGPMALFQGTRREPGGEWERQYWNEMASTLAIYEIPGYSNWLGSFFVQPNVEILANKLADYFRD